MPKKQIDLKSNKKKVDSELDKMGMNYETLVGAIIALIGIVLVVMNLGAVLMAFVGFVLIYFGMRMLGYEVKV